MCAGAEPPCAQKGLWKERTLRVPTARVELVFSEGGVGGQHKSWKKVNVKILKDYKIFIKYKATSMNKKKKNYEK